MIDLGFSFLRERERVYIVLDNVFVVAFAYFFLGFIFVGFVYLYVL